MRALEVPRESGQENTGSLTASNLAALLRTAGLPCITLTTEEGAAAEPASTAEEGLRIIEGSLPVRVPYARQADNHAALHRSDSHLMWLAEFAAEHRWSTNWPQPGWLTVHPDPWPATYLHDGREVFRATGRRVDEDLGSWVVFWIVEDADAWADAIEAEVAAEIARAPKTRRFATPMQQQRLDSAQRIREEGPRRPEHTVCRECGQALGRNEHGLYVEYTAGPGWRGKSYHCKTTAGPHVLPHRRSVRSTEHSQTRADDHVAGLLRDCPNPGVRYEAAPVTATAACVTCFCPMICADGQWWHHTGGYPAECPGRRARSLPLEPGDWEISDIDMTCGYCGQCVSWPETVRSWARLTGVHSLGVDRQTGELVVLAEVTGVAAHPGEIGYLAHHCTEIPDSIQAEHAADVRAVMEKHRHA